MLRRSVVCFILLSFFIVARGKPPLTPEELIKTLPSVAKQDGIQVGLIVDSHSEKEIYAEIITLPEDSKHRAYDVIQKSKVTKHYHPQYTDPDKGPLGAGILSLDGKSPDTQDGDRKWIFFTSKFSNGILKWIIAQKGISYIQVSDGDIIGFSRTAWVKVSSENYTPKHEPRIGK